jgi:hypothetical protein
MNDLVIAEERLQQVKKCVKIHYLWKINAHQKYRKDCEKYVKNRMIWESDLVQRALDVEDLIWSITYDHEKILRLANSSKVRLSDDLRDIAESDVI